ncbi:MAG: ABC transporter ATP-binding protein [Verrucomicrobia bacterium]|nr:ABC transporter ATP-binding protein [Verrucomicrobiota bacterium]
MSKKSKQMPKIPMRELLRRMWVPYKQLLPYLATYKARFILGLACGVGAGFSNSMVPLTLKRVADHIFPDGSKHVGKELLNHGPAVNTMIWICALIPTVMLIRSVLGYLNTYYISWVSLKLLNDIRNDLFRKIMIQPLSFFNTRHSGVLIGHIMNDSRMAQAALSQVSADVVTQPVTVITSIGVLLYLDWRFTIISLILFPVCLIPISVFGRKVRRAGGSEEAQAGMMMVILQEAFAGVRVVKALAREKHAIGQFEEAGNHQFKVAIKVRRAIEIVGPIIEAVSAVGVMMALVYVGVRGISAGTFLALVSALFMMYDPVKKLSKIHLQLQKALVSTERIFELMQIKPEIQDAPDAIELGRVRGDVVFEDVSFSYRADLPPAIQEINLKIESGKTYALVGQSGAGKSTILSLLLRFYDPQAGSIRMDGHDLRAVSQASLRKNIAIVTQDTFLFHTTIMENIRYGRLDATDQEVYAAAEQAFAHDFICAQPNGYATVVGDKGCMLSGGQQQRVAIARALLKNAPILLLDEATSALDSESEQKIQLALERLAAGRTVIAIAHRLSTILKADQIVSMVDGRIVEKGTHEELFEQSGNYRRLYDLQFTQHENGVPA